MERHCENALKVAEHLKSIRRWSGSATQACPDSPYHAVCQKTNGRQGPGHPELRHQGRKEAGAKFIDALQMILRLVNIGDAKSLACHLATNAPPAWPLKSWPPPACREDMVRLSIGIEHIDDIIADIDQALAAAG